MTSHTQMQHKQSLLRAFLSYYKPHIWLFILDTVCAIVQAAVDLAFPIILRELTSGLFTEGKEAIVANLALVATWLIAMYIVRYICKYFISAWGHIMGARMESEMRADLFDQYERFSFSYFDEHNTGDLMSRLVSDLFDISEAAHHLPEAIIVCLLQVSGSFIIMFAINWQLASAMALTTLVVGVYMAHANRKMERVFAENRERISGVNSQVEDSLGGARVVKSFANEDLERAKFGRANNAYLDSKEGMYHALGMYQGAATLLTGALYTIIIVFGGFLIAQGYMSPLDLATYALYVSLFTTPLQTLIDFTEMFQKAVAGFRRFQEIVGTPPDIQNAPGAKPISVSKGHVVYEDVYFAYEDNEAVLSGLSLDIAPGHTYALVGPSGGGKSTTCQLLPRFYDVDAGSITIDGQDIRTVDVDSLHKAIGIVQQDVYLFNGTIEENIAYGRPNATFEEICEAAKKANIAQWIEELPQGYQTPVGERGGHLSGGQKQRIAIARVFLKNPHILILDEATSALDNESEKAVQESLARLSEGRTTIVIAHRLSTIKDADVIVTIANGRVAEQGTHEELLARGGTYAHYYEMQFGQSLEGAH